jgi:hypothetical protein
MATQARHAHVSGLAVSIFSQFYSKKNAPHKKTTTVYSFLPSFLPPFFPHIPDSPFTFDMATAAMARGEISLALREGHDIPLGCAVDKNGVPTTNPAAALDGAQLAIGGYKGRWSDPTTTSI